jgi:hypothetical protein
MARGKSGSRVWAADVEFLYESTRICGDRHDFNPLVGR